MDPDTAETILWLRNPNNQRRFKMQVFEPPAVAMKVENQRYVNAIEACLSQQQMKVDSFCFVKESCCSLLLGTDLRGPVPRRQRPSEQTG